ncbi:peptidoglycan-binding domain-containing protein [Glycomyces arizonensis]|uniref:peptidoglycan-binding domain-containing protein n=1 Tax=Glycomyces arizonensis TaxID=256035 RepID=UPI000428DDB5|nr:peptidoglycan-binding protein [Glycomyces arizonensis]
MAWRLARSLQRLESEIQSAHPGTTVWDIGDEDHQDSWSDHNPSVRGDVVCALDILGDGGLDLSSFVAHLIANPHPNLRYVIYNRRIYQRRYGFRGRRYSGVNAHKTHVHVSVGDGPDGRSTRDYDDTSSWGVASIGHGAAPRGLTAPAPSLEEGDEGHRVGQLQRALNAVIDAGLNVDNDFGPLTEAQLKEFQRRAGIDDDGIYGPVSAGRLAEAIDALEDDMPTAKEVALEVWRYTNEDLTGRDAYAHLRSSNPEHQILTELAAAKQRDAALLDAVQGVDGEAILARIDQRAAEDAERDAAAAAERADILALIEAAQSGELAAAAVVDQIAARLTGAGS